MYGMTTELYFWSCGVAFVNANFASQRWSFTVSWSFVMVLRMRNVPLMLFIGLTTSPDAPLKSSMTLYASGDHPPDGSGRRLPGLYSADDVIAASAASSAA